MSTATSHQSDSKRTKINIINLERERRKFLFDPRYNPQFEYEGEPPTPQKLYKYGAVNEELLPVAERILKSVLKKYGSEDAFIDEEGPKISREETNEKIMEYLRECGLNNRVKVSYSAKYIARTSVLNENGQMTLRVRLPIEYRKHSLQPILNHEVGTHVFRWLNEEQQPWYTKHKDAGMSEYLQTEEGLAVLNAMTVHPAPHLWMPALYYFTTYHAQFLSFADLAVKIKPFVADPDRRFKTCLRAKRGLTDTSEPGSYTKDQVYLKGTIQVAQWLSKNQYNPAKLYLGKIALEDIDTASELAGESFTPILPSFMQTSEYSKALRHVVQFNKLLT